MENWTGDKVTIAKYAVQAAVPSEDLYGQLAEECCELAQAALKMQRILRGFNSPSVNQMSVQMNLEEEFSDILVVADVLGLEKNSKIYNEKMLRWNTRINGKEE